MEYAVSPHGVAFNLKGTTLFNQRFIKDSLERGLSTFAQAWAAAMAIPGPAWDDSLRIAGVAALISIAKAVAATRVGDSESASLSG